MIWLNLYSDTFEPGAEAAFGNAAARAVYVWQGAVRVETAAQAAFIEANSALSVAGAGGFAAGKAGARLLRFEIDADPAPETADDGPAKLLASDPLLLPEDNAGGWLLRCDRVDFPAHGEALLHTHQGPGTRCLIKGAFTVQTGGESHDVAPGEAWFEAGPEPVYAKAGDTPAAFVRVMILPDRLKGQSSIRYVNEADLKKPKSQSYQVFLDQPVELA
jgi:quercetin dioxygenase-like cupin family protein